MELCFSRARARGSADHAPLHEARQSVLHAPHTTSATADTEAAAQRRRRKLRKGRTAAVPNSSPAVRKGTVSAGRLPRHWPTIAAPRRMGSLRDAGKRTDITLPPWRRNVCGRGEISRRRGQVETPRGQSVTVSVELALPRLWRGARDVPPLAGPTILSLVLLRNSPSTPCFR